MVSDYEPLWPFVLVALVLHGLVLSAGRVTLPPEPQENRYGDLVLQPPTGSSSDGLEAAKPAPQEVRKPSKPEPRRAEVTTAPAMERPVPSVDVATNRPLPVLHPTPKKASTAPAREQRVPAIKQRARAETNPSEVDAVPRNRTIPKNPVPAEAGDPRDAKLRIAKNNYRAELSRWLDGHKYIPPILRRRSVAVNGELHVRIDSNGRVLSSAVHRSSNNALADEVALDWVKRADPFPRIPRELNASEFEFIVPVDLIVRGRR